jgi:uncharacterized protein YqgV (UPF0045/DUF77 family)
MDIGVEISLYPLDRDYIPPIQEFIDRLNKDGRFRVVTNSMSTQVFGQYDSLMPFLVEQIRPTFDRAGKAVFVLKVLGPLDEATS